MGIPDFKSFFSCKYKIFATQFLLLHVSKLQYRILQFYYSMVVVLVLMCGQFDVVMQDVISAPTFCTLLFYCLKLSMCKHAMNFATVSDIKLHLSVYFYIYFYIFVSHTLQYISPLFIYVHKPQKYTKTVLSIIAMAPYLHTQNNDNKVFL